jgi:hypothetical protein
MDENISDQWSRVHKEGMNAYLAEMKGEIVENPYSEKESPDLYAIWETGYWDADHAYNS